MPVGVEVEVGARGPHADAGIRRDDVDLGVAGAPVTSSPVTSRPVTPGLSVPLSLRLGIDRTRVIVSLAVTAYWWASAGDGQNLDRAVHLRHIEAPVGSELEEVGALTPGSGQHRPTERWVHPAARGARGTRKENLERRARPRVRDGQQRRVPVAVGRNATSTVVDSPGPSTTGLLSSKRSANRAPSGPEIAVDDTVEGLSCPRWSA